MRLIFTSIFMFFGAATAGYGQSSFSIRDQTIFGESTKTYLMQDGHDNSDSRWELKITFREDNHFIFDSTTTQEKFLDYTLTGESTTKPGVDKVCLEGNMQSFKDQIFMHFTRDLDIREKDIAQLTLGYDDSTKEAVIDARLEDENLVITVPQGRRRKYFVKTGS